MRPPRVLIGCEFSGVIRRAFRAWQCDAYSCDIIPSIDNSPYHLIGDVRTYLHWPWDLAIFHPDCTYLTGSGISWCTNYNPASMKPNVLYGPAREQAMNDAAADFFMQLWECKIIRVCIENPTGVMSSRFRKPDQYIQPWQHGHPETKKTGLWLRNLPLLKETNNVYDYMMTLPPNKRHRVHHEAPGVKNGLTREQRRSISFPGIANAMAQQYCEAIVRDWSVWGVPD